MVSYNAFELPERLGIGQQAALYGAAAFNGACNTPLGLVYLNNYVPQAALAVTGGVVAGVVEYNKEKILDFDVAKVALGGVIGTAVATASTMYVMQTAKHIGLMNDYLDSFAQQQAQGIKIEDMTFSDPEIQESHLDYALCALERERSYKTDYDRAADAYDDRMRDQGLSIFDVGFDDKANNLPPKPSLEEVKAKPLLNPAWSEQDEAIFRKVADDFKAVAGRSHRFDERARGDDFWNGVGTNYGQSMFITCSNEHEGTIDQIPEIIVQA